MGSESTIDLYTKVKSTLNFTLLERIQRNGFKLSKQLEYTKSSKVLVRTLLLKKTATEEILSDRVLQDQSRMLKKMIDNYMKITDTTIRDLVPKYIMFSLVSATQRYVREELVGDILKDKNTDEQKAQLLEASSDYAQKIKELLEIQGATQKAMDVFLSIK